MARLVFTKNLERHVECPTEHVAGSTVAECLNDYFSRHPMVRSYVLDERGVKRKHVAVFVGRDQLTDVTTQLDPVDDDTTITVMQALSGG
jgi:sulfur-carrier protein